MIRLIEKGWQESKVSILIPVSGNPVYLDETLQSILAQTHQNFEVVIVINDADSWVHLYLQEISEQDERFHVVSTVEKGISNALNVGMTRITSSFVCRIDSDDLMAPSRIQKQLKFLFENPDVGVVGSQVKRVSEEGSHIGASQFPTKKEDVKNCLTIRNVIAHPSVMFRTKIVEEAKGYRSQFNGAEDYDLWLRLREKTKLANIDECLTTYRVWSKQETTRNADLTHQLVRLIHIHQFSKLRLEFSSPTLQLVDLKSVSKKYYNASLTKSISEYKVGTFLRLVGINWLDSGIENLKRSRISVYSFIGLFQVFLGSPLFAKEIFKTFLIPIFRQRFKNAFH